MTTDKDQFDEPISHDAIDELVDDYVTRLQNGQSPSVSEYCHNYPQFEKEIRELFPMLSVLERKKPKVEREDEASLPKQLGGYELLREIGRGGMGVIYEARHRVVGRRVALKVLPQRLSDDPQSLARFRREARAIAALHHTNVVPLFDFESEEGRDYLVMQLIDGTSVDKLINSVRNTTHTASGEARTPSSTIEQGRGELPIKETPDANLSSLRGLLLEGTTSNRGANVRAVASLGFQIASALAHAHRRGIIHRDVKPSNVLMDSSGVAWLTDFGLAKTDDDDLTQTGDFLGTLRYTAPERLRGECDERSDVYALGLTLYELLAMKPAFESNDRLQLIQEIERSYPRPLQRLAPQTPIDLVTIVCKAIDHEPKARYQSAQEMADDLQRFLSDEPILARRLSSLERLARWQRKNRALATSLAVLLLLATLTLVGAVATSFREAGLRRRAEQAGQAAEESRIALRQALYFAEMNLAGQAANSTSGTQRIVELLGRWKPMRGLADLRGWEWDFLNAFCRRYQRRLQPATLLGEIPEAAWNSDGTRLALAQSDGLISIWDTDQAKQLQLLEGHAARVRSIAWSPDGTKIASGGLGHELIVWDASAGTRIKTITFPAEEILAVRWSPNSKVIACGNGTNIYSLDAQPNSEPQLVGTEETIFIVTKIQWSPDGTQLFAGNWWRERGGVWNVQTRERVASIPGRFVRWDDAHTVTHWFTADSVGSIFVWQPGKEQPIHTLLGHESIIRGLSWSPDGQHLASAGFDRSVRIWDFETGTIKEVLQGHAKGVQQAVWTPSGDRIASVGYDKCALVWKVGDGAIQTLESLESRGHWLTWQSSGKRIAAVGRRGIVKIWNLATGQVEGKLQNPKSPTKSVKWSPDGTKLASCTRHGQLQIWDTKNYHLELTLAASARGINDIDWAPDGYSLAAVSGERKLRIWDLQNSNTPTGEWAMLSASQCVRWSPDGKLVAVGTQDGVVLLFSPQRDGPVLQWAADDAPILDVAWSPNGQLLGTAGTNDKAMIWNVNDGRLVQMLSGHRGSVLSIDWHVDGGRIATCSGDATVRIWDTASGTEALRLRGVRRTGEMRRVRWSHNGRSLAVADTTGKITIWNADYGASKNISADSLNTASDAD